MDLDEALNELGIDRLASAIEIKAAYRKAARIRHPDLNKGAGSNASMQRLNMAVTLAMNSYPFTDIPIRSVRADTVTPKTSTRATTEFDAVRHKAEMAEVTRRANFRPGMTGRVDAHLNLFQAAWGTTLNLKGVMKDWCSTCGGDSTGVPCPKCRGTGVQEERRWHLEFQSPVGATHLMEVVVPGMGGRSAVDHLTGDLRVKIHVHPLPGLVLLQENLTSMAPVSVWKWIAGGVIQIMTLDGVEELTITPGQRSVELPYRGWPHPTSPSMRGPLTVMVKPVLPKSMTDEQVELLWRFAKEDRSVELVDFERRVAAWNSKESNDFFTCRPRRSK